MYNDIGKVLSRGEWTLNINLEQMNLSSSTPAKPKIPIRGTVMKWVADIMHGAKNGEYWKLSAPLQENLELVQDAVNILTQAL